MLKLYPSFTLFFSTLLTGIFLVLSSNNWLMTWMGLELSLLGFLPLLMGTSVSTEGMVKYFLIQAGASVLFLLSFMSQLESHSSMIFLISMAMKMGLAPFHQWVPSVLASLTWPSAWIMMTMQKLPPLILILKQSSKFNHAIWFVCAMSVLVSGLVGYNQTKMRPLLAYSSIAHNGWTVAASSFGSLITSMYFLVYCLVITGTTFFMERMSTNSIMKLNAPKMKRFILSATMFNLAGIPPFPMFWMKLMVLNFMVVNILFASVMLTGAAMTVFFYMYYIIPSAALTLRQETSLT